MRFCELDEVALGMQLASGQLDQSRSEDTAETNDQMALEISGESQNQIDSGAHRFACMDWID